MIDFLSIHIKSIGPWTWRLRNYFQQVKDGTIEEDQDNPSKMRIEGNINMAGYFYGEDNFIGGDMLDICH